MSERFHNPIHWRLNSQRYRLQGVRYENGEVRLNSRPIPPIKEQVIKPVTVRIPTKKEKIK